MFGIVTGGFLMAKGAMAAQEGQADPSADQRFLDAKLITARFFADQFLPQAIGLADPDHRRPPDGDRAVRRSVLTHRR